MHLKIAHLGLQFRSTKLHIFEKPIKSGIFLGLIYNLKKRSLKSVEFLKLEKMRIYFQDFCFFRVCARKNKDRKLHASDYEKPMHEESLQPEIRETFLVSLPKYFFGTLGKYN